MSYSRVDRLREMTSEQAALEIGSMSPALKRAFLDRDWSVVGRPEQFAPPGDWLVWFVRGGRGAGKGRTGAETLRTWIGEAARRHPETSWGLVSPRLEDVRLTQVEGEAGLARVIPRSWWRGDSWDRSWNRGVCELHLNNGAFIKGYSSEKPGNIRGPNFHGVWIDEPGTFRDAHRGADEDTTWTNALFALRAGSDPRMIVTGTPRNNRLIKGIRAESFVHETVMTTFDNLHNLAPAFRETIVARYLGTRLGRQELLAEILEDVGQILQRGWFEVVPTLPPGSWNHLRFWDLASTEPHDTNHDPDWTVGALLAMETPEPVQLESGQLYQRPGRIAIQHIARFRKRAGPRNEAILRICTDDNIPRVGIEQEPGRGGVDTIADLTAYLRGVAHVLPWPQGDKGAKLTRISENLAGPAEQGRVLMVRDTWSRYGDPEIEASMLDALDEFDEIPHGAHDDIADSVSSGIAMLTKPGDGAPAVSGADAILQFGLVG